MTTLTSKRVTGCLVQGLTPFSSLLPHLFFFCVGFSSGGWYDATVVDIKGAEGLQFRVEWADGDPVTAICLLPACLAVRVLAACTVFAVSHLFIWRTGCGDVTFRCVFLLPFMTSGVSLLPFMTIYRNTITATDRHPQGQQQATH